jgi:uncharacterized protein YoxC
MERTRTMLLLGAAFVVFGVGLGIFGVVRLAEDDPEIDRLNNEIAAVETDVAAVTAEREEVEARLSVTLDEVRAAEGRPEAMVAAAQNLDAALVDWVEHFEAFVEAEVEFAEVWVAVLARDTSFEQWRADVEAEVRPALLRAKDARDALFESFDEAEGALAEMEQILAESGGD